VNHNNPKICEIEKERKLEARMFNRSYLSDEPLSDHESPEYPYSAYMPKDLNLNRDRIISKVRTGLMDDTSMMEKNRHSLNKFESLSLGGKSLTAVSIGGFDIDISKTAEKAIEIIPLPPSRLPIIFTDDNLNFYHHFFQGMAAIIGQSNVDEIVRSEHHYADDYPILMPLIEGMMSSGYEKSDSESKVLVRKVITSTFEPNEYSRRTGGGERLKVAANLWGFQYIESGMQMAEVDLRMWFSICYSHYRTIWFNTFKTTGIPAFAMNGVRKSRSSISSSSTLPSLHEEESPEIDDARSTRSKRSNKGKSMSRTRSSARSSPQASGSYQMARWLSHKT